MVKESKLIQGVINIGLKGETLNEVLWLMAKYLPDPEGVWSVLGPESPLYGPLQTFQKCCAEALSEKHGSKVPCSVQSVVAPQLFPSKSSCQGAAKTPQSVCMVMCEDHSEVSPGAQIARTLKV